MLRRIFPKQFDNCYAGHKLGLAIFVAVMLARAMQGLNSVVLTRRTMASADGIPIDRYDIDAASAAISLFAQRGMYLLVIPIIGAIALVRYRSMIPLLYLMLLITQLGGRTLGYLYPITREAEYAGHTFGFYVNLGILALTVAGLLLSVAGRQDRRVA